MVKGRHSDHVTYLEVHTLAFVWNDEERINRALWPPSLLSVKRSIDTNKREVPFSQNILLFLGEETYVVHFRGSEYPSRPGLTAIPAW